MAACGNYSTVWCKPFGSLAYAEQLVADHEQWMEGQALLS